MRIKSHWFKSGAPKTAAEQASAMAFIVWRVAQNMLKRMRGAHFDIDAGLPYFAFMREVLVFLIAVTDRIAQCRQEFSNAIAADPKFNLTPAEAGHPTWGPVFRSVRGR